MKQQVLYTSEIFALMTENIEKDLDGFVVLDIMKMKAFTGEKSKVGLTGAFKKNRQLNFRHAIYIV